jgi:hypothetical protein
VRVEVTQPRRARRIVRGPGNPTQPVDDLARRLSTVTTDSPPPPQALETFVDGEIAALYASLFPRPVSDAAILRRIARFSDHPTRLALRAASRGCKQAADAELFDHAAVLAAKDRAVLTTPHAPFHRLPLDPAAPVLPPIRQLDVLKLLSWPAKMLPLPLLASALENAPIALLRAERFRVSPPAARAVLHVIPPDIDGAVARADTVIWHPYTPCLYDCLTHLEAGGVAFADLTIVLENRETDIVLEAVLDALGDYLLGTRGRLTVVCGKRYAAALGVPVSLDGRRATEWLKVRLREAGAVGDMGGGEVGAEALGRFRVVYEGEWDAEGAVRELRLPVFGAAVKGT